MTKCSNFICTLFLMKGKTHVMVGIKAELGEPDALAPHAGALSFFVEW